MEAQRRDLVDTVHTLRQAVGVKGKDQKCKDSRPEVSRFQGVGNRRWRPFAPLSFQVR
jgi:hypothetical protein